MEQNNNICQIFFIFSFIITFSTFSYYLFTYKFMKLINPRSCKCEICDTFITSSWRQRFTNLPDWITFLLSNSPTRTIHIHVLNNIITSNPNNVEHILKTKFDNYPKGKPTLTILGDLLGQGIFNVDGEHWRFQRKLASLELGSNSIRAYAHEVLAHEIVGRLVPTLEEFQSRGTVGGPRGSNNLGPRSNILVFDLQDVFRKFSFDNICKFSFGVDPTGLPGLDQAFDIASNLSAERALQPSSVVWRAKRVLNLGSERRLRAAIKKVNILAETIIKENRENSKFVTKGNLLSRFMGSVTNDKYLRDIVVSFLLAGRDTNASGLTVLFYLLGQHPEVEARIIEESNRVMYPNKPVPEARPMTIPTLEELSKMHYLNAVVYETMRLYPPVQMDSKFASGDDILPDGTRVETGTRVAYHPYAMGRMEDIWGPDCLQFRPERWLNDEGVFKPMNPFKYPVFQAGIRVCLGKEMALLVMKTVTLVLVRRFRIRLADPGWVPRFVPGLSATFKGGIPVVVLDRCLEE
ncbi:hypothetical protein RND81_04G147000 [Saponaria officinalis]|uniref:Cytochrome P450 n=1 Tax=Saponaria officinalis TaxID=3572 RepID=A0AAW1LHP5_SAPOF